MQLTLMAQNLSHGGLYDGEGNAEDRWPLLLKRIASIQPDILIITEALDWGRHGHRQLARAMHDLDMDGLLAPSSSGYHVGILYKRQTLDRWRRWNTDFADHTVHGLGLAGFDIGLPSLLTIAPTHLNPFSSDQALQEIGLITSRAYRNGPFAIIGGDLNYPPSRGGEPAYNNMLPYNKAARTLLADPTGPQELIPDRRIGWKLEQAAFTDVAYHLYEKTGQAHYVAHTGTDDRIDQFWVSQPLKPAILDYFVIDEPTNASDHKGIAFSLDTSKIDITQAWTYR